VIIALGLALPAANFPAPVAVALGRALLVGFVLALGWAAAITLDIAVEVYLRRFHIAVEDNRLARTHVTQIRILQRVARTLLAIVAAGAVLMTSRFDQAIRGQPVRLAGAAGSEQPARWNQDRNDTAYSGRGPGDCRTRVRLDRDDHQHLSGGAIWDPRRMIVVLTYFTEKPFQNWTYEGADRLGSVLLHVDHTVPVDRVRQKLDELVRQTPLWDGKVASLQVTDTAGAYGRVARPGERAQPQPGLGPPLQDSREADRASANRISPRFAESTNGTRQRSRRWEVFRAKLIK
jgi:hypothetical protein